MDIEECSINKTEAYRILEEVATGMNIAISNTGFEFVLSHTGGKVVEMEDQFLSKKEVSKMTGRSATSLWRDCSAGLFPPPRQTGPARIGWLKSEVVAWMKNCPVANLENKVAKTEKQAAWLKQR